MDAHPRVAALGPGVIHPDGRHHPSAYRFPSPLTSLIGLVTLGQAGVEQSRGTAPRRVDWAQACALLVRRSAVDRVGGFDEGFFMYAEETDLQRRLRNAGFETHWLPTVTVTHARAAASAALPDPRLNEEWRSRHRYWRKHHGRLGSQICALAAAAQYALMSLAATVIRRPDRRRLWAASRNALRVSGPGLRELAAAHNPERAV
jgi:N-acetylglucosaminyl-diphospho-decaprenol L-rhamnosyltransferase